ncbi:hypothetical protein ACI2K4_35390 [Micromonospora sp. NPDC050397]|uniref:AMIN-like domain-containing (lipo)protein n=1 Tax=Micromonospora sp. NPDC050397 TaxID=3364279 RepID=UPI00384F011E
MTRQRVPILVSVLVLLAAGCTPGGAGDPSGPRPPATTPSAGPATPGTDLATAQPAPTSSSDPPDPGDPGDPATQGPGVTDYRITYDWGVPSDPVRVDNKVRVPVVPPPGAPLPLLVEVRVGDHPDENLTRITFAFRGGPPAYELAYVPEVTSPGTGSAVPLAGNSFVRIQFDPAQAHDEQGRSSIIRAPGARLDYPTLRGYVLAGDYEGYLSFGLGLRVPRGSDQVLPVRTLQLTRADGTRIVAVDVRRG